MAPQLPQQGGPPPPPQHGSRGRPARTHPEEAKTQLAARRPRAGETLAELAQDLLRLTKMAYPRMDSASQDELARDRLLVEVEDPVARKRARLAQPPSLATALRELTGHDPANATTPSDTTITTTTSPPGDGRCGCGGEDDAHGLAVAVKENTEAVRQLVEKMAKREEQEEKGWGLGWGWRLFW
ncbi:uncharacterized protein LOC127750530 [Frankliniella occidentalis]|uniref:Uncharacterized protein LOC127750530 n=1 Tax=Frankliniella occidentalis TaxID=133901 RepID=A0A9C6XRG8_FRAOC|nr:uncharacterized protein LOC127750530 [Frankliniella occidentalis]